MSNLIRCTAPVRGHRNGSAANCPVHGTARSAHSPDLAPPRVSPAARFPEQFAKRDASDIETPAEVLRALSRHEKGFVREEVAKNLSTPREVLEVLAAESKRHRGQAAPEGRHTAQPVLKRYPRGPRGTRNSPGTPTSYVAYSSEVLGSVV